MSRPYRTAVSLVTAKVPFYASQPLQPRRVRSRSQSPANWPGPRSRTGSPHHRSRFFMQMHGIVLPLGLGAFYALPYEKASTLCLRCDAALYLAVKESGLLYNMVLALGPCPGGGADIEHFFDSQALGMLVNYYQRPTRKLNGVSDEQVFALLALADYMDIPRIYAFFISEVAHRWQANLTGAIARLLLEQHREFVVDVLRQLPEVRAIHLQRLQLVTRQEYSYAFPNRRRGSTSD